MSQVWSEDERLWMIKAIEMARPQRTHPNPRVGCVIANDRGEVVGTGVHRGVGTEHAEQEALRQAGEAARGGTVVVTLEPCSHYGRTPPCAKALIAAGVARVVMATVDPDPRVSGRGLHILERAGIETSVGLLERKAIDLDPAYHHHRRTGRPYVHAIRTGGLEQIDQAVREDLDAVCAGVDFMVPGADPAMFEEEGRAARDCLVDLGEKGHIYLGVRDEFVDHPAKRRWPR